MRVFLICLAMFFAVPVDARIQTEPEHICEQIALNQYALREAHSRGNPELIRRVFFKVLLETYPKEEDAAVVDGAIIHFGVDPPGAVEMLQYFLGKKSCGQGS